MKFNSVLSILFKVTTIAVSTSIAHAETTVRCEPLGTVDSVEIVAHSANASDCGTYLDEAGKDAKFCNWEFSYRSPTAREAFTSTENALDGCFRKTLPEGSDVNHPDSYDQIFYVTDNHTLSLSLKDKAEHEATYLFLRIEVAP